MDEVIVARIDYVEPYIGGAADVVAIHYGEGWAEVPTVFTPPRPRLIKDEYVTRVEPIEWPFG